MQARRWLNQRLKAHQARSDTRWRKPPRLNVQPPSGQPTVYYLAPAEKKPSGGIKVIYRHVDLLNEHGIPAAVLHEPEGFRCDWFRNQTRIVSVRNLLFHADDILVLPECYGPGLHLLAPEVRKVIFNQGPHHTFDRISLRETAPGAPYQQLNNIHGILTVSHDGADLLRLAFPGSHIAVVRNVIDKDIFRLGTEPSGHRIGYVPSRRSDELHQLLHLVRALGMGTANDWELVPIQGRSEQEVASILRTCTIFLSLSDRDGFGLPPAEAMACGSYVVGYPGGGGKEFFDSAYCSPAHDTTEVLRSLADAMRLPDATRQELGAKASARILGHYTADGLRADLLAFYRDWVGLTGPSETS